MARPRHIVVAQWPRLSACTAAANTAEPPPARPTSPPSTSARDFSANTGGLRSSISKKVAKPEDRFAWTRRINLKLLQLEREVFLAGCEKAFLLFLDSCNICAECVGTREACKQPRSARPTPEALAVDVYATVKALGYPIEVLPCYDRPMNRYAFLLID